jgi:type I restriction enzyme R subunit
LRSLDALQLGEAVLFLADRVALVNQAVNAFRQHLPDASPLNLVTEKDAEGRAAAVRYRPLRSGHYR